MADGTVKVARLLLAGTIPGVILGATIRVFAIPGPAATAADLPSTWASPHRSAGAIGVDAARKMIQNLVWAAGYNVIAIPLAAGCWPGPGSH